MAFTDPTGLVSFTGPDDIRITQTEKGWIATNTQTGKVITSSQIEKKLKGDPPETPPDLEGAVQLILEFFGYTVHNKISGDNILTIDAGNYTAVVHVEEYYCNCEFEWSGITVPSKFAKGEKGRIDMYLQFNGTTDPAALFHLVGHEAFHMNQITSGSYEAMMIFTGEVGLRYEERKKTHLHLEMEAYMWNMQLLSQLTFCGAEKVFMKKWLYALCQLCPERCDLRYFKNYEHPPM